jgi:hypothetical protein
MIEPERVNCQSPNEKNLTRLVRRALDVWSPSEDMRRLLLEKLKSMNNLIIYISKYLLKSTICMARYMQLIVSTIFGHNISGIALLLAKNGNELLDSAE